MTDESDPLDGADVGDTATVRAVLTVLDAAANPTVSRASFAPASERGDRR